MRAGTRTLAAAIPPAARIVPANRAGIPGARRRIRPVLSTASSTASAPRRPNRRARRGANGASPPKQTIGTAVRTEAPVADRPVAARRSSSTDPTLATAGRRLMAINTTPTVSATGNAVRAPASRTPALPPAGAGLPAGADGVLTPFPLPSQSSANDGRTRLAAALGAVGGRSGPRAGFVQTDGRLEMRAEEPSEAGGGVDRGRTGRPRPDQPPGALLAGGHHPAAVHGRRQRTVPALRRVPAGMAFRRHHADRDFRRLRPRPAVGAAHGGRGVGFRGTAPRSRRFPGAAGGEHGGVPAGRRRRRVDGGPDCAGARDRRRDQ